MKFRCEREILAEALSTAGRAATSRSGTLPVLSGVRLDVNDGELTVTGTDLELTIRLTIPVHSDRDGASVVPARLVSDIVKSMPAGAVDVDLNDDDELSISSGRSNFSVRPLALADFPAQSEPDGDVVMLSASSMADALRQVVRAASTDDARAVLTGVLLAADADGLQMVATDSYRLAVRDLPPTSMLNQGQKVLLPSRALGELQKILTGDELGVRLGEREAVFEVGEVRLTTRLIEGEYPNVKNLLPNSHPNLLTVGKADLEEALRRVKILAQDSTPVRLTLGGDTLQLTAITQDVGNAAEEIDANYSGSEMTVAFNPDYLAAGLDAIEGDEVTIATMDPMKPVVLRGVGHDDYLYLLMPVRVP